MKWDIDKALTPLEPESCSGTTITRAYLDEVYLIKEGLKPLPTDRTDRDGRVVGATVWCLALGHSYGAKAFIYGRTIRQCYLRAKKIIAAGKLAESTPWGVQAFTPRKRKAAT